MGVCWRRQLSGRRSLTSVGITNKFLVTKIEDGLAARRTHLGTSLPAGISGMRRRPKLRVGCCELELRRARAACASDHRRLHDTVCASLKARGTVFATCHKRAQARPQLAHAPGRLPLGERNFVQYQAACRSVRFGSGLLVALRY